MRINKAKGWIKMARDCVRQLNGPDAIKALNAALHELDRARDGEQELAECRGELAASEARERQYREALSGMISNTTPPDENCDCDVCEAKFTAYDALAPVPNDHALIEMIERERADIGEQVAKLRKDLIAAEAREQAIRAICDDLCGACKMTESACRAIECPTILILDALASDHAALDAALSDHGVDVLDAATRILAGEDAASWDHDLLTEAEGDALERLLWAQAAALEQARAEGADDVKATVRAELQCWIQDSDRDKYVAKKMLAWLEEGF